MDRVSAEQRSKNMAAIRGRDTLPEIAVRRALRRLGLGYRLHARDLPGRPDIVMRGRRTVIFVHGCFWHRHAGCKYAYMPKTRQAFWSAKFSGTVARDHRDVAVLVSAGWKVLIIWECQCSDDKLLLRRITCLMG